MKASELIEEPQAFMDMMGIRMFLMFEEAKRVMDPKSRHWSQNGCGEHIEIACSGLSNR